MKASRAYTLLPLLPMSKIRKTPAHQQLRQACTRARARALVEAQTGPSSSASAPALLDQAGEMELEAPAPAPENHKRVKPQ